MSYTDPTMPGLEIEINSVKHLPKCARCYKHLPEVNQDPVFSHTCPRCAQQMHTLFYDVNFGHGWLLPNNLTRDVEEFIQLYVRENLRHMNWQQIQDYFKDIGYP